MNLHIDAEAFKELIELASEHFGYEQSHVEKDYWVCKILKEISESEFNDKVYFKGGTSLSKAYHLIQRFSEDLDLFVFTGDIEASKQAEKTLNKKLSHFVVAQNNEIYQEGSSKVGGNYRKLYFSYDNIYKGVGLKEYLEVEIKSCDLPDKSLMYYPADIRTIKPIITGYLESIDRSDIVDEYGLAGFEMKCINPRKTICDKISRLVRLSYGEHPYSEIAKHIRDVYDLYSLYNVGEYQEFILSSDFFDALSKVAIEDGLNKNSHSSQLFSEAVIFRDTQKVMMSSEVATAYSSELRKLVFNKDALPEISGVMSFLQMLQKILSEFDRYRNLPLNN